MCSINDHLSTFLHFYLSKTSHRPTIQSAHGIVQCHADLMSCITFRVNQIQLIIITTRLRNDQKVWHTMKYIHQSPPIFKCILYDVSSLRVIAVRFQSSPTAIPKLLNVKHLINIGTIVVCKYIIRALRNSFRS